MENKIIFAKIFEFENYQVLITKDYEPDDDTFKVTQRTDLEGVQPSMAIGFEDEESRDNCFENYTKEDALNFIRSILRMF